jgi:uncharacterized protein
MFSKNKNRICVIVAVIVILAIACLFVRFLRVSAPATNPALVKTVQIGGAVINVELAATQAEQIQGLSGRTSLASSTGKLFVFNRPSKWGIWMKDMNFPIDVLWINDDLKVVYIVENMSPASYPKVYTPSVFARYVLEVPVGTVKNIGVVVGQSVVFK